MENADKDLLSEGGREIIAILKDLDNPENVIYKSAIHLLTLREYVTIRYGKNPDGSKAFKLEPSKAGERIVNRFDYLTQKEKAK